MYFRLRQLDVMFMRKLHEKVNIVPVIAKADTLTPREIKKLKATVSINQHSLIQVFNALHHYNKTIPKS